MSLEHTTSYTFETSAYVRDDKYLYTLRTTDMVDAPTTHPNITQFLGLFAEQAETNPYMVSFLGLGIKDDVSTVYENRGIRGMYDELRRIRWDVCQVNAFEAYSQTVGATTLQIASISSMDLPTPQLARRLKQRYDELAQSMGYSRNGQFYQKTIQDST